MERFFKKVFLVNKILSLYFDFIYAKFILLREIVHLQNIL